MGVTFEDLSQQSGLKQLDDYLLTRSYITAYQASRDDLAVYVALKNAPPADLVNASRWYKHITALLGSSFPAPGVGVAIGGAPHVATREFVPAPAAAAEPAAAEPAAAPAAAPQTPPPAEKATEEDDDDLDLFGDETEEEAAAAAAREEAKKTSKKPAVVGKSSVLLDVKPWDDETDMVKLEEIVRSVEMPGLLWGASKLQTVVAGIKKLTIMMTIVDDLVSVDNLIEDHLLSEPASDYIQSCDIAAFNKICKPLLIQQLQLSLPGAGVALDILFLSDTCCLMSNVVVGLQKLSGPQFWLQHLCELLDSAFFYLASRTPDVQAFPVSDSKSCYCSQLFLPVGNGVAAWLHEYASAF